MSNYYVVSSGEYSDYGINFIFKSPDVITPYQMRGFYSEGIKRSSDFEDKQNEKLSRFLNKEIKSRNYFTNRDENKILVSFEKWGELLKEAGVEDNPSDWMEKILVEHGCEIITYEEFNTDDLPSVGGNNIDT